MNELDALREENMRLRAAVLEMQKMLPVLEFLEAWRENTWDAALQKNGHGGLDDYRQALEIALAKRSER